MNAIKQCFVPTHLSYPNNSSCLQHASVGCMPLNALKLILRVLQARFELGDGAGSSRRTPGGLQCTITLLCPAQSEAHTAAYSGRPLTSGLHLTICYCQSPVAAKLLVAGVTFSVPYSADLGARPERVRAADMQCSSHCVSKDTYRSSASSAS